MTLAALRAVFRTLTNEQFTGPVPDATVDVFLQDGLDRINDLLGFAVGDDGSTALVAGTAEYAVPADVVKVLWVEWNGRLLERTDMDQLRRDGVQWRGLSSGEPNRFVAYGRKLILIPAPSAEAVAQSNVLALRAVVRSVLPTDPAASITDLCTQHHAMVVKAAAQLWSNAHPDGATAWIRSSAFEEMLTAQGQAVGQFYAEQKVAR